MALSPSLDIDIANTKRNCWYAFQGRGQIPTARVGHTLSFFDGKDSESGKVVCVGGANPSGAFSEVYMLDLATWCWESLEASGFEPRYEHAAFVPQCSSNRVYVFGGANQSGNISSMQKLDITNQLWEDVPQTASPPQPPRTHHTCAVISGDRLVVFGGGHSGAEPVDDVKIHVFDACTDKWTCPDTLGTPPKPRQGHVMGAVASKVYVHGGMSGADFYNDLNVLDMISLEWGQVAETENNPCARAAHGAVVHGCQLFVFGGMNATGALNDLHSLDTETETWTRLEFGTPPPSPRLDFGMCLVLFPKGEDEIKDGEEEASASLPTDDVGFIMVHGGMNAEGDIFDNCYLLRV